MKEHQHTEWKASWRDEYLKWICGFANADGGVLVLGRNDQGKAVGVENAARLLVDIPNKVRDILGIMVECEPAPCVGQGHGGNRGGTVSQPYQLQGRISLPQRQHQAGTQRCGP